MNELRFVFGFSHCQITTEDNRDFEYELQKRFVLFELKCWSAILIDTANIIVHCNQEEISKIMFFRSKNKFFRHVKFINRGYKDKPVCKKYLRS